MSIAEAPEQPRAEGSLRAVPDGAETAFDRLAKAVDDYRKVRADARSDGSPDPSRLADLRTAEQAVRDCIRTLDSGASIDNGPAPAASPGHDPQVAFGVADPQLVRATLALVDQLAVADRDSSALVERLIRAGDQGCPGLLRAALHCQGLVTDALLIGAVELADRMGVPASRLPL